MVSKCANPSCSTPFLYLHEGRIFAVRPTSPASGVERYWLCGSCAQTMTVVLQDDGVSLRFLPSARCETAKAGSAERRTRRPAA